MTASDPQRSVGIAVLSSNLLSILFDRDLVEVRQHVVARCDIGHIFYSGYLNRDGPTVPDKWLPELWFRSLGLAVLVRSRVCKFAVYWRNRRSPLWSAVVFALSSTKQLSVPGARIARDSSGTGTNIP